MTDKIYGEIASYIRCRAYTQEASGLLRSLLQVLQMAYHDNDLIAMEWIYEKIKRVPCAIKPEHGEIVGIKLKAENPIQLLEDYCFEDTREITQ